MKKKYLYSILATALLAVVAIVFFWPDAVEGRVLQQADTVQGMANSHETSQWAERTGHMPRWTDALFGGMPNFQISPDYPARSVLNFISAATMLWLPQPAGLLFLMMAGFFMMCLCFRFKWPDALFGAVAWGLSSYFIILIGAGHIWKFETLAYIPPTIGGLALLYRGRRLVGTALTALFAALQLNANHPQMTYYFLLVVVALVCAWLWQAWKGKSMKTWGIASCLALLAATLAVAANAGHLYYTARYAKETVRGRATDLSAPGQTPSAGMDRDAITAWSYGLDESFTLLVPNVKGGATIQPVAGRNTVKSAADTERADAIPLSQPEREVLGQFPQYFGDQPMTNGPVYTGAFVLLLAVLALFMVKGPLKWALFAASVIALMLSWGHNFPALTYWMIDNFPAYNKFRVPASMLVVVEFCVPLLAVLCVRRIADNPESFRANPWLGWTVFGAGAAVCFLGWVSPSVFGSPFSATETEIFARENLFSNPEYAGVLGALRDSRLSLVSADSLRSLLFIAAGTLIVGLYAYGRLRSKKAFVLSLAALALVDLFGVDRRYVNSDNFTDAPLDAPVIAMTEADRAILADTSHYRVADLADMGGARSSYFHKTVGGYHAAKLTRYNDLLEHQIQKGNPEVFNMLNTKYFMADVQWQENPAANGPAWFVEHIDYVKDSNAEMEALDTVNTRVTAVADERFRKVLGAAGPVNPGDTVVLTSYAPDRLAYRTRSSSGGIAVFSEVYFPWGWRAAVDGKPVELGQVDYVLRALRVPAGQHEVVMEFTPEGLKATDAVGLASVIVVCLGCLSAFAAWIALIVRRRREGKV